jgi:hypothetical protein
MYSEDVNHDLLATQLKLLNRLIFEKDDVTTTSEFASWLKTSPSRQYLCQVEQLTALILTLLATNAVS